MLGGYTHWFKDTLGVRGYILANGASWNVLQLGVGSDVIWNIGNLGGGNIGIFGGLQLGMAYWVASWSYGNTDESRLGFDAALNIGGRYTIMDMHRVELGLKIPFTTTTTGRYNYNRYWYGDNYYDIYKSRETMSLSVRYIWEFH